MSKPGNQQRRKPAEHCLRNVEENRHAAETHSWRKYPHHDEGCEHSGPTACATEHVDTPRNTKEKTIMTLESASSGGRVRDALPGRTKVAIVTGASSGIGLEVVALDTMLIKDCRSIGIAKRVFGCHERCTESDDRHGRDVVCRPASVKMYQP